MQQEANSKPQYGSSFSLSVQDNIAIVTINTQGRTFNLLDTRFTEELHEILDAVVYQKREGLIFISGKQNNFIRGFNLTTLEDKTEIELEKFAQDAQAIMHEIESLNVPTVAAIHGDCYGVGLELALACQIRIATVDGCT
ncbi:MAG TPA: fatty-acid oxidation protein subunit alpha, partial [Pasteurellaceae bacterium]|nr:fatty-acid oxidation protein subunit alpha [Pasteurellaceae bacterium]